MATQELGAAGAEERAYIATLLSRYPNLSPDQMEELHFWFKRGATALDLGILAGDPNIATQYRAYRAEHYDRITLKDYLRVLAVVAVVVAVVGVIAWLMP